MRCFHQSVAESISRLKNQTHPQACGGFEGSIGVKSWTLSIPVLVSVACLLMEKQGHVLQKGVYWKQRMTRLGVGRPAREPNLRFFCDPWFSELLSDLLVHLNLMLAGCKIMQAYA